ncbi:MAG: NAD(P)H-hydrate epimerase, partial [Treponema sp.]|nr:NAD(P)H-hydrate epimerase [Treponema sp.]
MKTVTSAQMRLIEKMAIEELGIPALLLMENAAIRTAEHCFRILGSAKNPKTLIVCGSGNNGGDGMAIARHLHIKGVKTKVLFVGDINTVKGETLTNLKIVQKLGILIEQIHKDSDYANLQTEIESSDLVADAIFGTGLARNVEGDYKKLIEAINRYAKFVVSVDIPSGIHSDTGRIMGCAVKANETITFGFPKTGLFLFPAAEYAGKLHIEDISIPYLLIDRVKPTVEILTDDEAKALLPVRAKRSNKGTFGKVAVFAGSNEMPGAAALACSAAYATGCGLVCAFVLPRVAETIHHWQREIVTCIVPEQNGMYCKKSIESLGDEINNASVI